MQNFADRLVAAIKQKGNPICVGLDPRLDRIPGEIVTRVTKDKGYDFDAAAEVCLEFGKGIIDAVYELVPAVKPQLAFYEQFGAAGAQAFADICTYAKEKGLLVIADGKRNDIGSTAEAYAKTYLGEVDLFGNEEAVFAIDALTVTPYLGYDGIKPFVDQCEEHGKGIFVLVKTSNPSSGDFQDRVSEDGITNYEYIGHFVESWGADLIGESGFSSVGAVVGATYPSEQKKLRELMPNSIFLVPGYGAQGAGAEELKSCFTEEGLGALVNSSRGIIFAYEKMEGQDYQTAARLAVEEMARDLTDVIG